MRRYSRGGRRGRGLATVVQSFKKVINVAPASVAAGANNLNTFIIGTDSTAAGQTSAIDGAVPTGSIVKYVTIQLASQNLVNVASFQHVALQFLRSGQVNVSPNVVGGNPQRNQVIMQDMYCVGQNQNVNRTYRVKIPKRFQRIQEGTIWRCITQCDTISTQATQIIYKFYR